MKDKKVYKLLNEIVGELGYKRYMNMSIMAYYPEITPEKKIPSELEGEGNIDKLREDFDLLLKYLKLEIKDEPSNRIVKKIKD